MSCQVRRGRCGIDDEIADCRDEMAMPRQGPTSGGEKTGGFYASGLIFVPSESVQQIMESPLRTSNSLFKFVSLMC